MIQMFKVEPYLFVIICNINNNTLTCNTRQIPRSDVLADHSGDLSAQTETDYVHAGQRNSATLHDCVQKLSRASGRYRQINDRLHITRFGHQMLVVDGHDVVVAGTQIGCADMDAKTIEKSASRYEHCTWSNLDVWREIPMAGVAVQQHNNWTIFHEWSIVDGRELFDVQLMRPITQLSDCRQINGT